MMYLIRTAWYLINDHMVYHTWGFPGGSAVKNLPAMQETRVQFLGLEDPVEKEMATPSSTDAWKIPWTEEPGSLQSMAPQRIGHHLATKQQSIRDLPSTKGNPDMDMRPWQ